MTTDKDKTVYTKHVYDIDLKELIISYESGIRKVELSNTHHSAEALINLFKDQIKNYCDFKKILFEDQFQILVVNENDVFFWKFLAYSLMFMDPYKIKLFLNYHKKHYVEFHKKSETDFVNLIEFRVHDFLRKINFFDNEIRLEKIIEWIDKNRNPVLNLEKAKSNRQRPVQEKSLQFISKGDISLMKKLSAQLQLRGYTSRKTDFLRAITNCKEITWRKEIAFLVYLIDKLTNHSPQYITTNKGSKFIFKALPLYFHFTDIEKEKLGNLNFSNLLYNMKKRSVKKYFELRKSVDFTLKIAGFPVAENEKSKGIDYDNPTTIVR